MHVDESGYHGLSCYRSLGHQAQREPSQQSTLSTLLEPSGLFCSDGKHPDGVTVIPWKNRRALVWDVTCADTFATS